MATVPENKTEAGYLATVIVILYFVYFYVFRARSNSRPYNSIPNNTRNTSHLLRVEIFTVFTRQIGMQREIRREILQVFWN